MKSNRLARIAVAVAFLLGAMLLMTAALPIAAPAAGTTALAAGANNSMMLNISSVSCVNGMVQFHFVVVGLFKTNISSYGSVSYTVNGQQYTANFWKRTGGTAHYVGTIAPNSTGQYNLTAASVTIDGTTVNLHNPGTFTVTDCGTPTGGTTLSVNATCGDGFVLVTYTLNYGSMNVTDFGSVSFTVDGKSYTATNVSSGNGTATYEAHVDLNATGTYVISGTSLTIMVGGVAQPALTLGDQSFNLACKTSVGGGNATLVATATCATDDVLVNFTLNYGTMNVTNFGFVTFTAGGKSYTATKVSASKGVAHYQTLIELNSTGTYTLSNISLDITANGQTQHVTLANQTFNLACKATAHMPSVTTTAVCNGSSVLVDFAVNYGDLANGLTNPGSITFMVDGKMYTATRVSYSNGIAHYQANVALNSTGTYTIMGASGKVMVGATWRTFAIPNQTFAGLNCTTTTGSTPTPTTTSTTTTTTSSSTPTPTTSPSTTTTTATQQPSLQGGASTPSVLPTSGADASSSTALLAVLFGLVLMASGLFAFKVIRR